MSINTPFINRMPVIFVGHGSPMNAIEDNVFTEHLVAWGKALPTPAAILVVSAHWLTPGLTAVDAQEYPPTLHDFYGFPEPLFKVNYPAPGSPKLAQYTASLIQNRVVQLHKEWGLDHGAWSILKHMYPKADIPVFQLSIDYDADPETHYQIGKDLFTLRDKGVLIMGSGNITHNLYALTHLSSLEKTAAHSWAQEFDEAVKHALETRDDQFLIDIIHTDAMRQAHPTPDHYLPLLYILGATSNKENVISTFEAFQAGTISMRCLQIG